MEGLREAAAISRSIASLMKVSPELIRPAEKEFRDKIQELLGLLRDTAGNSLSGTG